VSSKCCSSLVVLGLALAGCFGGKSDPPDAGGGACNVQISHDTPLLPPSHVAQGSVIEWPTNPPTSGAHYLEPAAWATTYPFAVMRGNYVHNEEHGGIVMLYNCPDGCADVVDSMTMFGQALPQDPQCATPVNARWIVTPDPLLDPDVRVAAAAWGWSFKADCFDETRMMNFFNEHYAAGGPDRTNCKPPTEEPAVAP
jgi:hypothetical protein